MKKMMVMLVVLILAALAPAAEACYQCRANVEVAWWQPCPDLCRVSLKGAAECDTYRWDTGGETVICQCGSWGVCVGPDAPETPRCTYNRGCETARGGCCLTAPTPAEK